MEMSELSSGAVESSDQDEVKLLDEVKLIIRLALPLALAKAARKVGAAVNCGPPESNA